jgi:O-antigen/teichoic acid export membrane protein
LGENLNVLWILGIRIFIVAITFTIGAIWLHCMLPQGVGHAIPKYKTSEWLRSALPLILFEGMHLINSRLDIFMLGAMKGVEAVGIYAVINRGVQLIIFVLAAVNSVLAPTIASFYTEGKIQEIQKIITKSSRIVFLISCLVSGTLIGCSYWYLLIFGTEFTQGQNALVILSIAQLFNASTGSVGFLLTMTGHEKYITFSVAISAIINALLNTSLIPRWGINGAAIATASTMILVNLLNVIWTKNKIGINPTAFGKIN